MERLRPGGGGHHQLLTSFFPCDAHRVIIKISHSRGTVPGAPPPFRHLCSRRGSRISARGWRQGIDDLIWDGDERFLTYANTDLQLFKMFIAILCLNGVKQPFKRHQCPFFLPLRRRNLRVPPSQGWAPDPAPPPPPGSAPVFPGQKSTDSDFQYCADIKYRNYVSI